MRDVSPSLVDSLKSEIFLSFNSPQLSLGARHLFFAGNVTDLTRGRF